MESGIIKCSNCGNEVSSKFCGNCGQPARLKRVDFHYVSHEVQHLLHFEKGFIFTVKELMVRPGQTVREFISFNRSRLVKPVIFLIVTSLIYSTLQHFYHVEDGYVNFSSEKPSAATAIFTWVQSHYGYGNIIMGVFIAWWIKVFFKKYGYNFFEILILLCFVMGIGMLMLALFAAAEGLLKIKLMEFGGYIFFIYSTWAIGSFFDKQKVMNYVKAFSAYLLGMLTFVIFALLAGGVIDVFYKH